MKHYLFGILLFIGFQFPAQDQSFQDQADSFFKQYVREGRVAYSTIHTDPDLLNSLVDYIGSAHYQSWDIDSKKAYFINAYNILVIDLLVKNYPIDSPMDITGFFDEKRITVFGQKLSLNYLEKSMLFGLDKDPRFHLALVCGANGCPPIAAYAYDGMDINDQLEQQTTVAMNNTSFVQYDGANHLGLSKIFEWYADDFGGKKNLLTYVNRYSQKHYNSTTAITYYDYDWGINEAAMTSDTASDTKQPSTSDEVEKSATTTQSYSKDTPITKSGATPKVATKKPSNVQAYTPSVLLKKGQVDMTWFNTIYTQNRSRWMGIEYSGTRETFFTSLYQMSYGVSKSSRFNIGVDFTFGSSGRSSDDAFSKVGRAFDFTNTDSTRVGLTSVGFRVKVAPFKNVSNFSIESSFSIPTTNFSEGRSPTVNESGLYFLSWQRYIWWNRFFYDKTFRKFQFFTEGDLLFRLRTNKQQYNALDIPISIFLSYFASSKSTLYIMGQHVERVRLTPVVDTIDDAITTPANYTTYGFGGKYQLNSKLNLELLFTDFFRSKNAGLGETYNVGLKYIF